MALSKHKQILVMEQYGRMHRCCPCETGEKDYQILSGDRKLIFKAREELDSCCRRVGCCCRRDFDIELDAPGGGDTYRFYHGRMCCSIFSCCSCCRHRMTVYRKSDGKKIGSLENECRFCCTCYPKFAISDEKGDEIMQLTKDVNCLAACCGQSFKCCGCQCAVPTGYTIKADGEDGLVTKMEDLRAGLGSEDTYAVTFPPKATEDHRVLLIAATILVDYTLYDDPPVKQQMSSV